MKNLFEIMLNRHLANKRDEMKEKYKRVLPTGEMLFNRFDKAKYLGYDKTTSVYDSAVIMGDVKIGTNCWIGPNSLIEGIGANVSIGNYVSVGPCVQIFSHDSSLNTLSSGKMAYKYGDINIGNNVHISSMSMILCGVNIGSNCLIAPHSLITKSFPNNSIISGSPARVIGEIVINEDGTIRYKYNRERRQ